MFWTPKDKGIPKDEEGNSLQRYDDEEQNEEEGGEEEQEEGIVWDERYRPQKGVDHSWGIDDPTVVQAIRKAGFLCQPGDRYGYWHWTNIPFRRDRELAVFNHGYYIFPDGAILLRKGASLFWLENLAQHEAEIRQAEIEHERRVRNTK